MKTGEQKVDVSTIDASPNKRMTMNINPINEDYYPENLKIYVILSKRFVIKEPPFNVDIFGDEGSSEKHIFEGDTWSYSFYMYLNRDEALDRLNIEKAKYLLEELVM